MTSRILLVTATSDEADVVRKIAGTDFSPEGFWIGNCEINLLITGVGSVSTSWSLSKWFHSNPKPDMALNIGIAGSYRDNIEIGDVVIPVSDCFADAGIETGTGFVTLAEAGLENPDRFPFVKGKIIAENKFVTLAIRTIKPVAAITVNTASGSEATIERLVNKYDPDIETMEGATFFYVCSVAKIPFLALRAISNRVEPRNKGKWNIPYALDNLSGWLEELLLMLE